MKNIIRSFIFLTVFSIANYTICLSQVLPFDDFEKKYSEIPTAQLIDVRTSGEYGGGHLPNAQNIDYRSADFTQKIQALDKTKPVFVYCLSGGRSKAATEVLKQQGFNTIYELAGGYLKWTANHKPTEGAPQTDTHAKGYSTIAIDEIIGKNAIVVLDFFASWCGPCIKMMPTVDKLSAEMTGKVKFIKVDADASKALMETYKIDEIPTFLIFKNGKQVMRAVGYMDEKAMREMILN